MVVCENCFRDKEIVSVIRNKDVKGNCPLCNSRNVHLYDTDQNEELGLMFDELLSIYTPNSMLPESYPSSEKRLLLDELVGNWNLFSNIDTSIAYNIITAICKDEYEFNSELFDELIGIRELYDKEYLSDHSLLSTNSWDDFVESLETKNRFHTHFIDLNLLERFCTYIRKAYKAGDVFWRCRISDKQGISKDNMGAPPTDKTTDGRANARGIRCLYLGDSEETTIYETRAGAYDYVTVGKFALKKDIIVVDLKMINQISPFIDGLDCLEHAINKKHLNKINDEMSKIMRRSDSPLDYIPTQYITDFIKSITHKGKSEYAGIEYKSAMHDTGYNLALFDPDLAECIETKVYRIESLEYGKQLVS